MRNLKEQDIKERLLKNDTLFRDVHIIKQKFDILPEDKEHYGVSIAFQDIQELREDFINDLLDTIVDWVYSSEKYKELRDKEIKNGKTEATAFSTVRRKAEQKFRKGSDSNLLVQGQFGELLLFHCIPQYTLNVSLHFSTFFPNMLPQHRSFLDPKSLHVHTN